MHCIHLVIIEKNHVQRTTIYVGFLGRCHTIIYNLEINAHNFALVLHMAVATTMLRANNALHSSIVVYRIYFNSKNF